jgi:predicted Rdx family selenoprotein
MNDKNHPQTGEYVNITVNGVLKQIHRGHQTVAEIKTAGGVPISDELAQVINGVITPLPDNGAVTIKGGEVFIGHPRDSSSA